MKYFIKTFGCQANVADSEKISAFYQTHGREETKNIDEADLVVINTCSVRQSAEHRVYGLINNLSQNLKKPRLVLTGCMLRYPLKWLQDKIPAVDEFKKTAEFESSKLKDIKKQPSEHALVSIMEGCNNFCSYCVVPYARGREQSKPFAEIICEAEQLAKRGCEEITLLGQNVNSYGKDFSLSEVKQIQKICQTLTSNIKTPFALLLHALNNIEGLKKIKFLTSNPWDLTDDIIQSFKLPKIEKYLHLPVQSGDDEILKKMNRHYTAAQYLALVQKIKKAIPGLQIGTDIIVGFPTETEEQFQHTVDLCQKSGFCLAYISKYSPRPGTAAHKLKDDVSHAEKKRRWRILEELINK